jgi:hypothetical protein
MWRCAVFLLVVGACDKKAPAKRDPWASKDEKPSEPTPSANADPWASKGDPAPTPSEPTPTEPTQPSTPSEPPASGDGMPAGTYACQQMRYTANTSPTYVPVGISFELDGNGGYSAPNFSGGPGTVSFEGKVVSFNGGAMNGWRGFAGATSSTEFIRIRLKATSEVATDLRLGDGMCYRQR